MWIFPPTSISFSPCLKNITEGISVQVFFLNFPHALWMTFRKHFLSLNLIHTQWVLWVFKIHFCLDLRTERSLLRCKQQQISTKQSANLRSRCVASRIWNRLRNKAHAGFTFNTINVSSSFLSSRKQKAIIRWLPALLSPVSSDAIFCCSSPHFKIPCFWSTSNHLSFQIKSPMKSLSSSRENWRQAQAAQMSNHSNETFLKAMNDISLVFFQSLTMSWENAHLKGTGTSATQCLKSLDIWKNTNYAWIRATAAAAITKQ